MRTVYVVSLAVFALTAVHDVHCALVTVPLGLAPGTVSFASGTDQSAEAVTTTPSNLVANGQARHVRSFHFSLWDDMADPS